MRWSALLCLAACGRVGFDARSDGGSGAGDAGDGGVAGDATVPPMGNLAFVTSSTQPPFALGSLAGADAVCRARATEAQLPGTFVAYFSTSAIDAYDRIAGARGWYRPDGKPVADTADDLVNGRMLHPMRIDELGRDVGDTTVYSVTGSYQGRVNANCGDLMSVSTTQAGFPQFTGGGFSNTNNVNCADPAHLYCLQTDFAQPLVVTPASGRVAFLSSPLFDPSAGLSPADALCNADAFAASLVGTFRALLPGPGTAASRFDDTGPPWVRTDGVELAPTAAALLRIENVAPLDRLADGTFVEANAVTGMDLVDAYAPPQPMRTCDNWTNAAGTLVLGYASATGSTFFKLTTANCMTPSRVYCLEI